MKAAAYEKGRMEGKFYPGGGGGGLPYETDGDARRKF